MAKVTITIEDDDRAPPGQAIRSQFQFTPDLDVTSPPTMAQSAGLLLHRTLNDALRPLDAGIMRKAGG